MLWKHSDCNICKERANTHCQGIVQTKSFNIGLATAVGKKLECFKWTLNTIFKYHKNLKTCYLIKLRQYKILPGFVFVYYGNNDPNIFCYEQAFTLKWSRTQQANECYESIAIVIYAKREQIRTARALHELNHLTWVWQQL
jgi:hypothetical protein